MKYNKFLKNLWIIIPVGILLFFFDNFYREAKYHSQGMDITFLVEVLEAYIKENDGAFPTNWDRLVDAGRVRRIAEKPGFEVRYRETTLWRPIYPDDFKVRFGTAVKDLELRSGVLYSILEGKPIQLIEVVQKNWGHDSYRLAREGAVRLFQLMVNEQNKTIDNEEENEKP